MRNGEGYPERKVPAQAQAGARVHPNRAESYTRYPWYTLFLNYLHTNVHQRSTKVPGTAQKSPAPAGPGAPGGGRAGPLAAW
ncbi:hypothetical protein GCM10027422_43630 [Hymenobacter arcticus]